MDNVTVSFIPAVGMMIVALSAIITRRRISMWWIELAILPCALISIPIIRWCIGRWPEAEYRIEPQANP